MKYLKILSVFLFFVVLLSGSYVALQFYVFNDMHEVVKREPIPREPNSQQPGGTTSFLNYEYKEKTDRPFTILLLGSDSSNLNAGRVDTVMLTVVDPKKNKIYLLSFPRDTRMEIAGKGKMDKVNHSFNYGVSTTIATIENYLEIPVDYYLSVNFNGFIDLVDELGGVKMNVEKNLGFHDRITNKYFTLNKGEQQLSGIQALNYARYRSDGEGDFGRNRRQQQVITAIIDQSVRFRNVAKITDIFEILGKNARTDLSLNKIIRMAIQLNNVKGENVETIKAAAYPTNIGGVSYVEISNEEKVRIQKLLSSILKEEYEN